MEGYRSKELPIGSVEKIIKEREKLTLPVENVKNTVVSINPAFPEAPFKLEQGKPTRLGLFFTSSQTKEAKSLTISPEEKEGRSGLLGSIVFRDKDGLLYRDVDLKGTGYFKSTEETRYKNKSR